MKVVCIGGGPAGLYLGILLKRANPAHEVIVYERNRADDTFGFGVVFSDATLGNLAAADPESHAEIRRHFAHWDAIDTHVGDKVIRSVGHGFCGLERKQLLLILQHRCRALGVDLRFETEVPDAELESFEEADLVIGADGVASRVRDHYADRFEPCIDVRPNRFVWLGTTVPFQAFTFYFKESPAGLWRIHAYRYSETGSTFIAECTAETFARTGLAEDDEDATIAYLAELFATELDGHPLIKNRSLWRQFPTVSNARWHAGNLVLVGDAAHTAHFSIGSGTKLAMEDCIALARAVGTATSRHEIEAGLVAYEAARRPPVERLQAAAQVSLEWFENAERYVGFDPLQFTFSLLTRSLRVTAEKLRVRDPSLVAEVERHHAEAKPETAGLEIARRLEAEQVSRLTDAELVAEIEGCGGLVAIAAADTSAAAVRELASAADRLRNGLGARVLAVLAEPDVDAAATLVLAGRADKVAVART